MKTTFTPGPWRSIDLNNNETIIVSLDNSGLALKEICSLNKENKSKDEVDSNANLIAAAPEMLEALQQVAQYVNKDWNPELAKLISDVLEKAKGNV